MADTSSPPDDETLALCRLIASIEAAELAATLAAVRFPKSDAIGSAVTSLAKERQRLLDALKQRPDAEQASALIEQRSGTKRKAVALLAELNANAAEPRRKA